MSLNYKEPKRVKKIINVSEKKQLMTEDLY